MAEPGDPKAPEAAPPEPDMDEAVGFASPASLAGRPREVTPPAPPTPPEPEPELFPAPEPQTPERAATPEPVAAEASEPPPAPPVIEPTPALARETPRPAAYAGFGARRDAPTAIEGASGLYSVYALILFAVPTLGVSAVIALLAVTGRAGPSGDVAASHFVFQQRTLWAGGVVALAGAILIVVGLGVFVLFALAVWLILRGAAGVLKLKAGRAMPNPRGWLF
jgi:uncharacterized membrane protein